MTNLVHQSWYVISFCFCKIHIRARIETLISDLVAHLRVQRSCICRCIQQPSGVVISVPDWIAISMHTLICPSQWRSFSLSCFGINQCISSCQETSISFLASRNTPLSCGPVPTRTKITSNSWVISQWSLCF